MLDGLFARIEDEREALVGLTRELVRFPTVNPPGEAYGPCARHLGDRLSRAGFDVSYLRAEGAIGDSERYPRINVIARYQGRGPGPCVHFNGHIDVVEAGHGWTVDPFAGVVQGGRLHGRGTCDMKGGIAAAVVALESILAAGVRFDGALEVSGTVDEESGGFAGVAYLAEQGRFSRPQVDHVIIPEPHSVNGICLGHRGVWWAEIETLGRVAHGSMPFLGECAIRHMAAFLNRVERQLLPQLATRQTAMPIVPPGARQSTLNINAVHGGQSEERDGLPSPVVADRCRVTIDRRFLSEEDPDQIKAELIAILEQLRQDRRASRIGSRTSCKCCRHKPPGTPRLCARSLRRSSR